MPSKVTCNDPSGRVMVASVATATPAPATTCGVGTVSGGHAEEHDPVHVVLPVPSGANRYSVNPDWSTRMVPSAPAGAAETMGVALRALAVRCLSTVEVEGDALELQAAASNAVAPNDPITTQGRIPRDRRRC